MPARKRKTWIAAACAVVVVIVGVVVWHNVWGRSIRIMEGTVTFVDAANRRAGLEYEDPKSVAAIEFSGEVPPDSTTTINGQPATLADVRVGDHGRVKGRVKLGSRLPGAEREKRIIARWVQASRSQAAVRNSRARGDRPAAADRLQYERSTARRNARPAVADRPLLPRIAGSRTVVQSTVMSLIFAAATSSMAFS